MNTKKTFAGLIFDNIGGLALVVGVAVICTVVLVALQASKQ